jgi:hypothetical protein
VLTGDAANAAGTANKTISAATATAATNSGTDIRLENLGGRPKRGHDCVARPEMDCLLLISTPRGFKLRDLGPKRRGTCAQTTVRRR